MKPPRRARLPFALLALLALAWGTGFGRSPSLVGSHASAIDPAMIVRRFTQPIPFDRIESEYSVTLGDRATVAEVLYVGGADGWTLPRGKVRIVCVGENGMILEDVIGRP